MTRNSSRADSVVGAIRKSIAGVALVGLLLAGVLSSPASASIGPSLEEIRNYNIQHSFTGHIQNIGDRSRSVKHYIATYEGSRTETVSLGTTGRGLRLENVSSRVANNSPAPALQGCRLTLQGHVQNIGWQTKGSSAGTVGRSLRLEAIRIWSSCDRVSVSYRAHVAGIGWQRTVAQGAVAGTTGQGRAIEALDIKISVKGYGDLAGDVRDLDRLLS